MLRKRAVRLSLRRVAVAAGIGVLGATLIAAPASADSNDNGGFEGFALGEPLGQGGWSAQDIGGYNAAAFDNDIVNPSGVWGTQLGTRALRMSNSVTSLAFGNQLQSFSLAHEAGETAAADSPYSGGTRQSRLSGSLTFASATQTYQPGLAITVSPDEGSGTRMAFFRISDQPGGLRVSVSYTTPNPGDVSLPDPGAPGHPAFFEEVLAENLDRTQVHTLEFTIDFVDGENNDILWARVGTAGCANWSESGTWETYHRLDGGGLPHPVDSLLFRVSTDPDPGVLPADRPGPNQLALMNYGLLFDNIAISTSTVPPTVPVGTPGQPGIPVVTVVGDQVHVTGAGLATNPCSPITEYRITLVPLLGGTPLTFTGPIPDFTFPKPTAGTWRVTLALTNSEGTSVESDPTDLTVVLAATGTTEQTLPLGALAAALTVFGVGLVLGARRRAVR